MSALPCDLKCDCSQSENDQAVKDSEAAATSVVFNECNTVDICQPASSFASKLQPFYATSLKWI